MTPPTTLRIQRYDGEAALTVAGHLEALDADFSAWLKTSPPRPGLLLMTGSADARLVGYLAARVSPGHIRLERFAVAPALDPSSAADFTRQLVEGTLEAADLPWADVQLGSGSPALPHLLRTGWHPAPTQPAAGELLLTSGVAT